MNRPYVFFMIADIAIKLQGKTINGQQLAHEVDQRGGRTGYGTQYKGGRGTFTLLRCAYRYFESQGSKSLANLIATSFTKKDGKYPWQ